MSQNNEVLAKRQATDYGPKKKPKVELRKKKYTRILCKIKTRRHTGQYKK